MRGGGKERERERERGGGGGKGREGERLMRNCSGGNESRGETRGREELIVNGGKRWIVIFCGVREFRERERE